MKGVIGLFMAVLFVLGSFVSGCSQASKSANSQEAIQVSKNYKTVEEQVNYLVTQANQFINSQKFDEAVNTAKYILSDLDKNSAAAQGILEKAKNELAKQASGALDSLKNKISEAGK